MLSLAPAPARSESAARPEVSAWDLRASRSTLVLGTETTVELWVTPRAGDTPRIVVDVGRVSELEPTSDGRLRATYRPPSETHPQVAIVAVVGAHTDSPYDAMVLRLHGSGQVDTTTEPGASITIQVGKRVFGPFHAPQDDQVGWLEVPIIVAPGVSTGTVVSTDGSGHREERPFELSVPPFKRVLAACVPHHRLSMVVVDAAGKLMSGARLRVHAQPGTLSAPREVAPGVYESTYTAAPDTELGASIRLSAELVGSDVSTSSCTVPFAGYPPAEARLELDPAYHVAGSDTPVEVRLRVSDHAGRPAYPTPVELIVDAGESTKLEPRGAGQYVASWRLPSVLDGKTESGLTARIVNGTQAFETRSALRLLPGELAAILLEAQRSTLRADGHSETLITARPIDAFGNPIKDVQLVARAEGALSEFEDEDRDGVFRSGYSTPLRFESARDSLRVGSGDTEVTAELGIDLLASRRPLAVAAKLGYATNFGVISSPFVVAELAAQLPVLERSLGLSLEVGHYQQSHDRRLAGAGETAELHLWAVPIALRVLYGSELLDGLHLYGGVAGGAHIVGVSARSPRLRPLDTVSVAPGFGGVLGGELRLGPGWVAAEVGYGYVPISQAEFGGTLAGLTLVAGYRVGFGSW